MPYFNQLAAKQLAMKDMLQVKYLVFLLSIPLLVGLMAGVYPAFYLSSFNPIKVLKGKFGAGFKKSNLRNSLVVFQFAATIILIIGTIVVYRQLNFIQTKQLGYNRDQVLIVRGTLALGNNKDAFKNEVSKLSGVSGATYAGYLPVANSSRNDNSYSTNAVMSSTNSLNLQTWTVDDQYIPLMGMQVISGRNFSKDFPSDSNAVVINETTAKLIEYKNPVGEQLYTFGSNQPANGMVPYHIIGVVKNFNFESLKENVGPLLFRYGKSDWAVAFKVNTSNIKNLVASVEDKWKALAPGQPFVYNFMDEFFDDMYRVEQRAGQLGLTFAVIAILIACLGLFGLATYMAEQRIKEIGVRKVLGASVANITTMLSKDFIKLVLIASVIALPVGWWAMRQWLQDFAYRIDISWWVFGLAIFIAVMIAILTVSSQAIKAALANPVKSLRTE
jgi:putative ABC transport system permease protein